MYILLKTGDVWHLEGSYSPQRFFDALFLLATSKDIAVVGTYNAAPEIYAELLNLEDQVNVPCPRPYEHSFDFNRDEFSKGRAFDLPITDLVIKELKRFCEIPEGSLDKPLFFDHIIVYRPGCPLLPLLNFHDAFNGGALYLSGHYQKSEIESFSRLLGASFTLEENPELKS